MIQKYTRLRVADNTGARTLMCISVIGRSTSDTASIAPAGEIAMPVTPIRPMPFHGFWRAGVMAKVLEGRIRDRLGI